jgi:hypothetical protein
MNITFKIILIAFEIVNAIWPFLLAWFIPGFIGGILGVCLGIFDGSEFVLGPLTLIAAITYLVEKRREEKKE